MIIFVSGATKSVKKYKSNYIGQLMTPQDGNLYRGDAMLVAVDNCAYSNWDERKFVKLIDSLIGKKVCWVAAPDVVGDAVKTSKLYDFWYQEIKVKRGLPIAYVLQDGQDWIGLPFDYDALFIGGTTEFKLGGYVRYCVTAAKEYGKWCHMGRVNSWGRLRYAIDIGCDSIDGSGFSIAPEEKIPVFLKTIQEYEQQQPLF